MHERERLGRQRDESLARPNEIVPKIGVLIAVDVDFPGIAGRMEPLRSGNVAMEHPG